MTTRDRTRAGAAATPAAGTSAASARVLRWLALCGLASPVLFFLSWFVAQFFEADGYSILRDFTSDLGALTAAHPGPYNLGTSLSGVLAIPFAAGLYAVFRRSLAGAAGAACVAVYGLGTLLDGLLREDCAPRAAACKALEETRGFSWHHQAHDLESLVTVLSIVATPFLFAAVFRRIPAWRPLGRYSLATGVADVTLLVPFVLVALQDTQPAAGLLQRLVATVATAWLGVVAWWLWRHAAAPAGVDAGAAVPA